MAYAFASSDSGLPASGGIMAVPTSGAGPAVIAGTPAPDTTSQWGARKLLGRRRPDSSRDRQRHPVVACRRPHTQHAAGHALVRALRRLCARCRVRVCGFRREFEGCDGHQDPDRGGRATVLVDEQLPNLALGGMADTGDALLLQLRWHPEPTSTGEAFTRVWRIPKDGTPHSDVRSDVDWADALGFPQWLAWDGNEILGPISVAHYAVTARLPAAGHDRAAVHEAQRRHRHPPRRRDPELPDAGDAGRPADQGSIAGGQQQRRAGRQCDRVRRRTP